MLATYKFNAADGHTIEATRTATGYDVHTRNAEGETISTVALDSTQMGILSLYFASAEVTPAPKPRARRKAAAK